MRKILPENTAGVRRMGAAWLACRNDPACIGLTVGNWRNMLRYRVRKGLALLDEKGAKPQRANHMPMSR